MLREDTERYYRELADYHRRMRDVPPEKMTDFFTNRIVGYEEHMLLFEAGYRSFAAVFAEKWNALPAEYRRRPVTDLGCGHRHGARLSVSALSDPFGLRDRPE